MSDERLRELERSAEHDPEAAKRLRVEKCRNGTHVWSGWFPRCRPWSSRKHRICVHECGAVEFADSKIPLQFINTYLHSDIPFVKMYDH